MTRDHLLQRLREVCGETMPLPGGGNTAERHARLLEIGREDLSLARLAEAHFDAVAILAEASREAEQGAIYGVWASERPGRTLTIRAQNDAFFVSGTKMFCSGAGIVDRALVTVDGPAPLLLDADLREDSTCVEIEASAWEPEAFAHTNTRTVNFQEKRVSLACVVGDRGWYLNRPGFWHGAHGPAACWAGGAIGLLDYARNQERSDPHTLAHRGAMEALAWSMQALLQRAGEEIDADTSDVRAGHSRALSVRHLIEQSCSDILQHFDRAFGPYPLMFVQDASLRHQELTIYLRQCHAERDLAALGEIFTRQKLS